MVSGGAALAGLAVGIPFGAVAARSGLCANSAVRGALFGSDRRLPRIFLVAVGVQLALLPVVIALGVDVTAPHLYLVAGAIGGFAFGVGMALAGGCASGILWRTGTGAGTALLAIAGFGAGELLIRGPLISLRETLDSAGPASREGSRRQTNGPHGWGASRCPVARRPDRHEVTRQSRRRNAGRDAASAAGDRHVVDGLCNLRQQVARDERRASPSWLPSEAPRAPTIRV